MATLQQVEDACELLRSKIPSGFRPSVLVICGSGLANLAASVRAATTIPYASIPGFPSVGVQGHLGEFVFGVIGSTNVCVMRGRFHTYEGHSPEVCAFPVRVAARLGCGVLVVTNAAGGIHPKYEVGDVMVIRDHIGLPLLAGKGPLIGPNEESFGTRFPSMSDAYDPGLAALALRCAADLGYSEFVRPTGTYTYVSGPQYETAHESNFIRLIGGDAVGMSTVPEVVVARHAGLRVLGLSLICNKVVLPGDEVTPPATHAEVLAATAARSESVQKLVEMVVTRLSEAVASTAVRPAEAAAAPSDPRPRPQERSPASTDAERKVLARIKALEIAETTPLQALKLLMEMKRALA